MGFDKEIGRGRRTAFAQVRRIYVLVLVILLCFLPPEEGACFVPSLATVVVGRGRQDWVGANDVVRLSPRLPIGVPCQT